MLRSALVLLLLVSGVVPAAAARDGERSAATATEAALPPQVFAAVRQDVVAVGEPFTLRVAVAFAVRTAAQEAAARQAVTAADWRPDASRVEVLRVEDEVAHEPGGAVDALTVWRTYTLRLRVSGETVLPPVTVAGVASEPIRVLGYDATQRTGRDAPGVYRAIEHVLSIHAEGEGFVRQGSAFLVGADAMVTSYHVVASAERVRVYLPNGRETVTARVWTLDPARDVAILHVDADALEAAGVRPLSMAPDAAGGAVAFTAGWPGGAQQTTVGERWADLVPAVGERIRASSNRVQPGDSGGPLLDPQGRVLGVVRFGRGAGASDILQADLCLATDPRLAIRRWQHADRPRGLAAALRAAAQTEPHAQALGAASSLAIAHATGRPAPAALDRLAEATRRASRDPGLLFLAAAILDGAGEGDRASAAYRAALAGYDGYFPAAYALASHALRAGRNAEAAELFAQTRQHPAYEALGTFGLAQLHADALRYGAAVPLLRQTLARDPGFAPAIYLLGLAHLAEERPEAAVALLPLLSRADASWADRLRLLIRQPVLEPVALARVPRQD